MGRMSVSWEDVCEWGGCVSGEDECVSKDVCGG